MSEAQIFQLFGLTFFAIGFGMVKNPKFVKNILRELERSTASTFYGGLISLAIGYFLVSFHNVWSLNGSLIITIMGWIALVKGLALIMFPSNAMGLYKNVGKYAIYAGYFIVVLGIIALYFGYFA